MSERDSKGRFQKGHKKYGGRGSRKKASLDDFLDGMIRTYVKLGGQKGLEEFAKGSPQNKRQFFKTLSTLAETGVLKQRKRPEEEGEAVPISFVLGIGRRGEVLLERAVEIFDGKTDKASLTKWLDDVRSYLKERHEEADREKGRPGGKAGEVATAVKASRESKPLTVEERKALKDQERRHDEKRKEEERRREKDESWVYARKDD